jgi:hypothetical protein
MLTLSSICLMLSYLAPLFALRMLGRSLYRNEALTLPVANAFRQLAHSLLLYALLQFTSGLLAGFIDVGSDQPGFKYRIDFGQPYLLVVACLCLYSVAPLMKLAAQAADDSRSIV